MFSKLRKLEKKYIILDTKEILARELDKNTVDVFYADDTHWTHLASDAIVKSKEFYEIFNK